jgi:hypothetical protein
MEMGWVEGGGIGTSSDRNGVIRISSGRYDMIEFVRPTGEQYVTVVLEKQAKYHPARKEDEGSKQRLFLGKKVHRDQL